MKKKRKERPSQLREMKEALKKCKPTRSTLVGIKAYASKGGKASAKISKINPTPKDIRAIYVMSRQGMAGDNIAYCLKISQEVFHRWKKEEPSVIQALKEGHAAGERFASRILRRGATKGHYVPAIFYLKTRHHQNWSESSKIELNGKLTVNETFAGVINTAPTAVKDFLTQLSKDQQQVFLSAAMASVSTTNPQ